MLGMAWSCCPVGMIADAIGRKRVLLTGLGLMLATSIGCAAANSLPLMLGLRFVQGLGAGTCLLLAATVAADCFAAPSSCRCWESSARHGGGAVLAPAVGGFIVQFVLAARVRRAGRGGRRCPAGRNRAPGNTRTRSPLTDRSTRCCGVLGQALRHPAFVASRQCSGLVGARRWCSVWPVPSCIRWTSDSLRHTVSSHWCRGCQLHRCGGMRALAQRTTTPRLAMAGPGCSYSAAWSLWPRIFRRAQRLVHHRGRSVGDAEHRGARPAEQGLGDGCVQPQHRPCNGLITRSATCRSRWRWLWWHGCPSRQGPAGLAHACGDRITTLLLITAAEGENFEALTDAEELCCSPRCYLRQEGRTHGRSRPISGLVTFNSFNCGRRGT